MSVRDVGRCSRCHKFLVAEQADTHRCRIPFKGVKEIVFDWKIDVGRDENGDLVEVGKGLDGIVYRLTLCKHNPPHTQPKKTYILPSDDNSHDDDPTTRYQSLAALVLYVRTALFCDWNSDVSCGNG